MTKTLSKKGAGFLHTLEGFRSKFYYDPAGVGTIGTGFTWGSAAFRKWWKAHKRGVPFAPGATITRAENQSALKAVIDEEYGAAVNNFFGSQYVAQHVWDATCSPVFNMGPGSLKWQWAKALKEGDLKLSAERLRTTGITINNGKKVLKGLRKRRKEEAELMVYGDYTVGGKNIPPANPDPMADGVLRRSERGEEVLELQVKLKKRGFYDEKLDGIYGYGTEAAVLELQRSEGLHVDGVAGPQVFEFLSKDSVTEEELHPPKKQGLLMTILEGIINLFFRRSN